MSQSLSPEVLPAIIEEEIEKKPVDKKTKAYRPYETLSPAFTNAAVALLYKMGELNLCEKYAYMTLDLDDRTAHPEPRYLQASLDFLILQGFLFQEDELTYIPTEKGKELFANAAVINASVETYDDLMNVLNQELENPDLVEILNYPDQEPYLQAMLIPAVSYFYEKEFETGEFKGQKVAKVLADRKIISVADINEGEIRPNVQTFIDVLLKMELLEGDYFNIKATSKGRQVFRLGGYAELIVSYYEMLQKMYPLVNGDLTYGLDKDINRHGVLNARASNGILKIKVAPYIVRSLDNVPCLRDQIAQGAAYLDYGSGGGDMLMQVAEGREDIESLHGLDISPYAVETAQENVELAGLSDKIDFQQGSIADLNALSNIREAVGTDKVVSSINFILHDVGAEMSRGFLSNHAKVFGDSPLIITESLKMPTEILKAYPNRQAPTFEFMHKASGQRLYTYEELESLIRSSNYEIEYKCTHFSMPDLDGKPRKFPTIVTWVVRARV